MTRLLHVLAAWCDRWLLGGPAEWTSQSYGSDEVSP